MYSNKPLLFGESDKLIGQTSQNLNLILISFSIFLLALLAVFHVFFPFLGDQAFFNLGAKSISNGAILYKDFWDIKQPGIFCFFYLGGKIFSFTEEGIHLFEILYWAIFSVVLVRLSLSGNFFRNKISNYLLPLFTVGLYLIVTDASARTQVEVLVSGPTILIIMLFHNYSKSQNPYPYFLSGILISCILFFKLIYLVLVAGIVLYHIIRVFNYKINIRTILFKKILPAFVGFLILPLIFFIYAYHNNIISEVLYTFFELPLKMKSDIHIRSASFFLERLIRYLIITFPLGLLSLIVMIKGLNSKSEMVHMLTILVFSAVIAIYMHIFYWYYYYKTLLFPMGILSLIFVDRFYEFNKFDNKKNIIVTLSFIIFILLIQSKNLTEWSIKLLLYPFGFLILFLISKIKRLQIFKSISYLGIAMLFSTLFIKISEKTLLFIKFFPITNENLIEYKNTYNTDYKRLIKESEFLINNKNDFKIYIYGDPLIYYLTNRMQAIPSGGWATEGFLPEQWEKLKEEISVNKPLYVYIDDGFFELAVEKKFNLYIDSMYNLANKSDSGRWYGLKSKSIPLN